MTGRYVDLRPAPVTDTQYVPSGATGAVTFTASGTDVSGDVSLLAVVSSLLLVTPYWSN